MTPRLDQGGLGGLQNGDHFEELEVHPCVADSAQFGPSESNQNSAFTHIPRSGTSQSMFRVGVAERASLMANRMQFSSVYLTLYVILIISNAALLIWLVSIFPKSPPLVFVALEITVTFFFAAEILVRALAAGVSYFKSLLNWFDMFVLIFCIAGVWISFRDFKHSFSEELDGAIGWVLLGLRYLLQFARLLSLVRQRRHFRQFGTLIGGGIFTGGLKRDSSHIVDLEFIENEEFGMDIADSMYGVEETQNGRL